MSKYKSIDNILNELKEIVKSNEIDVDDWITIGECLYITEYFKNEIPIEQIDIEWITISSYMWVCSIVINDDTKFLHFSLKIYDESESVSKMLN